MTSPDPLLVFDRTTLRHRRERAARDWESHAFLKCEIAGRLIERLDDVRRHFDLALDLGSHGDEIAKALRDRRSVGDLIRSDLAERFARHAQGPAVVADEEHLPFAAGRFDLVLSAMSLHWVNDLPGTLIQIGRILKPDGLFLGAMMGGETLWQLRQAFAAAESEIDGGLSPRISPFADLRDAAGLLQRAGFALPVADSETIDVDYENALALMRDLNSMGESNLVVERRRQITRRATLLRAAELYGERFAPPDESLADLDVVVFDVPDVGARFYTYLWTPSHVLEAMGVGKDLAQGAVRISLGWSTTEADVDLALKAWRKLADSLLKVRRNTA